MTLLNSWIEEALLLALIFAISLTLQELFLQKEKKEKVK